STGDVDGGCGKLGVLWTERGCPQVIPRLSTACPRLYPQIPSWDDWMSWRVIHSVSPGCPQKIGSYPQSYPRLIHSLGCGIGPREGHGENRGKVRGEPPRSEWFHTPGECSDLPLTSP